MSGKPGRSGPPSNLNSVKHKWNVFWRRRALKAEDRWILPVLESYLGALLSDKPDATETEKLVMQNAQTARGAVMLILAEAARSGFVRRIDASTWDLQPGSRELARFLTAERSALQALGMERRAKQVQTLAEWMADFERRKREQTPSDAEPEDGR